jgi:hypothetical protein
MAREIGVGYTIRMKTAISVPGKVFTEAERYARTMGKTRSQLYSDALRQYLLLHAPDAVTQAMNDVCEKCDQDDGFVRAASRRMLRRESW